MHHKENSSTETESTTAVGSPMQLVAVDILGPLPESRRGNRYILVAGDHFTHWMEAYSMQSPIKQLKWYHKDSQKSCSFGFHPLNSFILTKDFNLSQSWLHRSAKSLTLVSVEQHLITLKEMG